MKGVLWMKRFPLKRLRGGGARREGSSFTGNPGRYVKKVSGYGHFSAWGPLSIRGEHGMWWGEGSYTGDFDRLIKGSCSGGASLCEGFHEGNLEEGLPLLGNPIDEVFERCAKCPVNGPLSS
jgi:hypothetical protein